MNINTHQNKIKTHEYIGHNHTAPCRYTIEKKSNTIHKLKIKNVKNNQSCLIFITYSSYQDFHK